MQAVNVVRYVTSTTEAQHECMSCVVAAAAPTVASLAASAAAASPPYFVHVCQLLGVDAPSRSLSKPGQPGIILGFSLN